MRAAKAKTAHFDEYIEQTQKMQEQRKLKKADTIFIFDPKLLVQLSKEDI